MHLGTPAGPGRIGTPYHSPSAEGHTVHTVDLYTARIREERRAVRDVCTTASRGKASGIGKGIGIT